MLQASSQLRERGAAESRQEALEHQAQDEQSPGEVQKSKGLLPAWCCRLPAGNTALLLMCCPVEPVQQMEHAPAFTLSSGRQDLDCCLDGAVTKQPPGRCAAP